MGEGKPISVPGLEKFRVGPSIPARRILYYVGTERGCESLAASISFGVLGNSLSVCPRFETNSKESWWVAEKIAGGGEKMSLKTLERGSREAGGYRRLQVTLDGRPGCPRAMKGKGQEREEERGG